MHDVRQLMQFLVTARELSFSRAAEQLGIAQPWLSERIRRLEQDLGVSLFERTTRRVQLTPSGVELLKLVAPLSDPIDRVFEGARALRGGGALLRIGGPPAGAQSDVRLRAVLEQFADNHPNIALDFAAGIFSINLEKHKSGAVDLVVTGHPVESDAEVEVLKMHRLSLAVNLPGSDPLNAAQPLRYCDFAGRRVILFAPEMNPDLYAQINAPFVKAGAVSVHSLQPSYEEADAASMEIATVVVPAPAYAELRHGLVRREIEDAPELWCRLVRRRGSASAPAEKFWALVEALSAQAAF